MSSPSIPASHSTAACESKISYIDGDAGNFAAPRYPIEELAESSTFLEVCYLLLTASCRTASEYTDSNTHHLPHECCTRIRPVLLGLPQRRPPDGDHDGRSGAVGLHHDSINVDDPKQRRSSAHRLIAKCRTSPRAPTSIRSAKPFVSPRTTSAIAE